MIIPVKIIFVCVLLTGVSGLFAVTPCELTLSLDPAFLVPESAEKEFNEESIRAEAHPLTSLIESDPTKNLVYLHPFIIMNSPQRLEAFHNRHKAIKVLRSGFAGGIGDLHPLYQSSTVENGGEYIEGHFDAVRTVVESIRAAARGDGSASKTVTLIGGAGTGKTKFLDILANIGRHNTSHIPEFFMYSFEWVNLLEFPALYDILRLVPNRDGTERDFELPMKSAIYQSPIAILPTRYQNEVVKMTRTRAIEISTVEPTPIITLNPQNKFIRDAIVDHYTKAIGKTKLSDSEIIAALNKHVVIKRHVLSGDGRSGKIGYQGKDIDWGGLTFTENPAIKLLYGSSHPFAYHYDGSILTAEGGYILFDEFWRNEPQFLDFTLDLQESKVLQRGGSAGMHVDAVIFAASNSESLKKATGSDGTQTAQTDRARPEWMRASTDPYEIARTILPMKSKHLKDLIMVPLRPVAEALSDPNGLELKPVKAELDALYPWRHLTTDPYPTPDRRYAIFYNAGPTREPVSISPWALAYISYVTAASRMITDVKKAEDAGLQFSGTMNTQVFRDEVQRIKALIGHTHIQAGSSRDLKSLSAYLQEGAGGITTRDAANVWLTESINAAQRDGNDSTVTPTLVRNVFLDLLEKPNGLKPKGNSERLKWLRLLDRIALELIFPEIRSDFAGAISEGIEDMNSVYGEFVLEIFAISADEKAVTYENESGQVVNINLDRMREIKEIYLREESMPLPLQNIMQVAAAGTTANGNSNMIRRHMPLMRTLKQYYAKALMQQVSIAQIARVGRTGNGLRAEVDQYNNFARAMHLTYGYNQRATLEALNLLAQEDMLKRNIEKESK